TADVPESVLRNGRSKVGHRRRRDDQERSYPEITCPAGKFDQAKPCLDCNRTQSPCEPVRCSSFGHRHANAGLYPNNMTKCHPGASCQQTNRQCHGPAPTFSQKEQQEVSEIELFLNGESPKYAVDAVASPGIKIMEHQQMHREVVNIEARDTEANAKRCQ